MERSGKVEKTLDTLEALPIELLVYIFSFVSNCRDRMKLRYVSQRLRAAVETPSLWRDFIWPHFDYREKYSIRSLFKSCGRHVKRLSFPSVVSIHVRVLQNCSNVQRLSLPAVKLSVNQLRTVMQSMKKLQYLDVLWVSKYDVKSLLLIVGYPVYGFTIKELTIREQVKDTSPHEALVFLLNEWTASMLTPHKLNVVASASLRKVMTEVLGLLKQWWVSKNSVSQPLYHVGHLNLCTSFNVIIGLVPVFPTYHVEISFMPSFNISSVTAKNYGLSGSEQDHIWLSERSTHDGCVFHKGSLMKGYFVDDTFITPINIKNIEFLTHFSAAGYDFFNSEHLEQLAVVCPNLQNLDLMHNVNCLKCLQGLRAIATHQKLKGLSILRIPVEGLESRVKLWEVLVDLPLTYLAIDLCCLLGDNLTKEIIINQHQKCVNLKALETGNNCINCHKCQTEKRLLLSNFPSLIHCITGYLENVAVCDTLKYLYYTGWGCSLEMANCNLEQVCILSNELPLPDNFMIALSAHGGLVHVLLNVNCRVTQNGIAALIRNSPNLITCHVYSAGLCMSRNFRLRLKKKYAHRKLFLCGSYCFVKREEDYYKLVELMFQHNMDFMTVWH